MPPARRPSGDRSQARRARQGPASAPRGSPRSSRSSRRQTPQSTPTEEEPEEEPEEELEEEPEAEPPGPPRRSRRIAQEAPEVTDTLEEVLRSERLRLSGIRSANARRQGLPADVEVVGCRQDPPAMSPYSARCDGRNFRDRTGNPTVNKALRLQRILDGPNFAGAGDRAFARWFRPEGQFGGVHHMTIATRPIIMESWIGTYGQISWDSFVSKGWPGRKYMANAQVDPKRRAIEVFREGRDHPNGAGYYIRWSDMNNVRVNGVGGAVVPAGNFAFGPLPPFAIITIQAEDVVIFWWRDADALQAVPRGMSPPPDVGPRPPRGPGGGDGGGAGGAPGGGTGGDGSARGGGRRVGREPLAPRSNMPQHTADYPNDLLR
ncbi:MAG: hypothetical protein Q9174_004185 [Haloplaca sp. 1 TL-2023]